MRSKANEPMFRFDQVTKRYSALTVIDSFDFAIRHGEKVALQGIEAEECAAAIGGRPLTGALRTVWKHGGFPKSHVLGVTVERHRINLLLLDL